MDFQLTSPYIYYCQERQDDVGNTILVNQTDITSGKVSFRYHRNCRSSYVSPEHIKRALDKHKRNILSSSVSGGVDSGGGGGGGGASVGTSSFTRSQSSTPTFDWKANCFVCGELCNPKHRSTWSLVVVAIDCESGNMYIKMVNAAEKRGDLDMLARLHGLVNGDLVAAEARYHRLKGCYTQYISDKHIAAKQKQTVKDNAHKLALTMLIDEFKPLIVESKQVFSLAIMRTRFHEIATKAGMVNPEAYTSYRLKKQLIEECPALSFISQPGMSDLVCSSDISVGDALRKINELAKVVGELSEQLHDSEDSAEPIVSEESIVSQQ